MEAIRNFLQKPWFYLVLVIIGFALKLYRIEYSFFWRDEISTIEHTSGNQILKIPENEIHNITYYTDQLHLKKMNYTIGSELKGLFTSTNLNPGHYPFLMLWYRIAGDDPMSYRYFNIFILLLLIPVLFLLAKSLFNSKLAGWMAISLFVFSPYCHFYAHQARYNLFVIFIIILLHYVFLQAIKYKKLKWWIGYSLVGIVSMYASFLSGLMIFGHFLYVLFFKKEVRVSYILNAFIIVLCYLPWIISLITAEEEVSGSLAWHNYFGSTYNPLSLLLYQFVGFNRFFNHSLGLGYSSLANFDFQGNTGYLIIDVIVLLFIVTTIVYTIKKAPSRTHYFLIFSMLPFILFFLVSDLARQTTASLFWRYQGINYIGVLLFVVFFLHRKLSQGKIYSAAIIVGLVIIGFVGIMKLSKHKATRSFLLKTNTAEMLSKAKNPLIIADCEYGVSVGLRSFTAILNDCTSENIDILQAAADIENVEELLMDKGYSDIYVIQSSDALVQNLKEQFGERMDSLDIEGIEPAWKIQLQ